MHTWHDGIIYIYIYHIHIYIYIHIYFTPFWETHIFVPYKPSETICLWNICKEVDGLRDHGQLVTCMNRPTGFGFHWIDRQIQIQIQRRGTWWLFFWEWEVVSQHFRITGNVAYRFNGSPLKAFKTFISGSIGMIQSQEVTRLQATSVDLNRFELLAYNWVWECKKRCRCRCRCRCICTCTYTYR